MKIYGESVESEKGYGDLMVKLIWRLYRKRVESDNFLLYREIGPAE